MCNKRLIGIQTSRSPRDSLVDSQVTDQIYSMIDT